jgi:cytochrome P450
MNGIVNGPVYDWFASMIGHRQDDDHRRLRTLVNTSFTPRMLNSLRPFIRMNAGRLAEQLGSGGTCEFIEDFANPLPITIMCRLLGVPAEDHDIFRVWTTDIGLVFSIGYGGDIPARVETAVVGLYGYVESLIHSKKTAPADGLISALVAAHQDGNCLSRDELHNLIVTLVFSAHDTTRHQLANAMVAFSKHPEQWTLLGRHPDLATQATEEVIRWCPSSTSVSRIAGEDIDYQGLRIAEGTFLMVGVPVAQRDPRVVPNGDTFDIAAIRNVYPLQFGGGLHYCLGAALARAEVSEALPVLARRLGPPSIAGPVTWRPPLGIYGPNTLPLRFG